MRTRLKLDLGLIAGLVCWSLSSSAIVGDLPDPESKNTALVEIEYGPDVNLNYRERRGDWGLVFGFSMVQFRPSQYISPIGGETYADLFGSNSVDLSGFMGGGKYNFSGGSIAAELSYESGSTSDARIGEVVHLDVKRTGAHGTYYADAIWPEPYFVPYVRGSVYLFQYSESDQSESRSASSALTFGYTIGGLIQLNWLEDDVARKSLYEEGLNNTYAEVFMAQTSGSGNAEQNNFSSNMSFGAGLKLEF